eukprot:GHVS01064399.1.p1 GENE.GHVS01064399.1~~GHVS01064399.1.p1  ORF type:complete len:347 (+),score=76.37 GHVS01064399.1:168-1208(+)
MAKLTNADFRSLLLNSADQSVLQTGSSKKRKKGDGGKDEEEKEKRKQRYIELQKKAKAKVDSAGKSEAGEKDEASYRDRAFERRKGKDEFYQIVAEELKEMKDRSVEESKYLGGDVEHTHLVKGLDFALLNKVRSEIKTGDGGKEAVSSRAVPAAGSSRPYLTPMGRRLYANVLASYHPHHMQYSHRVNKIQQAILKGLRFKNNTETFLPGRTSFTFDGRFAMDESDTPTVVFRSRQDCTAPKDTMVAQVQPMLLTELTTALKWHADNKKKPKHDRLARRPGAGTGALQGQVEDDEDLDMFGGESKNDDLEEKRSNLKKAVLEERRRGNDMICELDEQMEVEDQQR